MIGWGRTLIIPIKSLFLEQTETSHFQEHGRFLALFDLEHEVGAARTPDL